MKTLWKIIFTVIASIGINQTAFAEKFEGDVLRNNVTERLPQLNHTKLEALMQRVGKKAPKNFYNCLCRKDGGGAAMGVGVSYHPEIVKPYNELYSCNRAGPPCMASGLGCWRFPLPNDSKITNYCIKYAKYDDGTTIVDAIVGEIEDFHVEQKNTQKITKEKNEIITIVDKSFAECPTPDCWVEQARDQLRQVLSNPDISKAERIRIVERSARTLKEYGQPSAFPSNDIPLVKLMQDNYNQSRKQWEGLHYLYQLFNNKLLDQKIKLINEIQIEVVGEQISFLIPGKTTFSMSKNLIQTVFDWDMLSGFNQGRKSTANGLVERFKELAKSKEIVKRLLLLYEDSRLSTKNLYQDYKDVVKLQDELRKTNKSSADATSTMPGYPR